MARIAVVPDLHFPFHHKKSLEYFLNYLKKYKPTHVVQLGDLYDFYSQARFVKKPGVIHAQEEIEEAHKLAVKFWEDIKKIAPKAKCYQLLGNHCIRPLKLVKESAPDLYSLVLKSWKELFKFKGVTTIENPRDDLEIDGIIFEHGYSTKEGHHLRQNMKSTVFGHTHRPWIIHVEIRERVLFELNCGYLGDPKHEALSYTPKKYVSWVKGFGLITDGVPHFIPIPYFISQ